MTLHRRLQRLARTIRQLQEMRDSSEWHEETSKLPRAAQLSTIRVLRKTADVSRDLALDLESRIKNYGVQRDDS